MTDWPSVHQNVIKTFAEGWSRPHEHAWDAFLTEDVVAVQPMLADCRGGEQWGRELRRLLGFMPDLTSRVVSWAGREHVVFIEHEMSGTVGGTRLAFQVFDKLEITEDGKLLRRDAQFDSFPLALRLLARPSGWPVWWRSGIGPLAGRRRFLTGAGR